MAIDNCSGAWYKGLRLLWATSFSIFSLLQLEKQKKNKKCFLVRKCFGENYLIKLQFWPYETCSFPFVRYFRTLFWDDITIIWDENIVYLFNWEKNLFWTKEKFIYIIFMNKLWWYHSKRTYENIVQKEMNKFQEDKI